MKLECPTCQWWNGARCLLTTGCQYSPKDGGTSDTQVKIEKVLSRIACMLVEKNRKYGDSALNPTRIFSRADPVEQIKVRIDDKLSRLRSAQGDEDEDVILDLIGYLVLLVIAKDRIA